MLTLENTNAVEQPTPEKPRRLGFHLEELEARVAPSAPVGPHRTQRSMAAPIIRMPGLKEDERVGRFALNEIKATLAAGDRRSAREQEDSPPGCGSQKRGDRDA
jgi:hypothetical protein